MSKTLLTTLVAAALLAMTGTAAAQNESPRRACRADYEKLCANQTNERPGRCMMEHKDQLSQACQDAIARARAARAARKAAAADQTPQP
ncbi:MAG: hypothetical protein ACRED9_00865 [Caulobacteraceae bacterium]